MLKYSSFTSYKLLCQIELFVGSVKCFVCDGIWPILPITLNIYFKKFNFLLLTFFRTHILVRTAHLSQVLSKARFGHIHAIIECEMGYMIEMANCMLKLVLNDVYLHISLISFHICHCTKCHCILRCLRTKTYLHTSGFSEVCINSALAFTSRS